MSARSALPGTLETSSGAGRLHAARRVARQALWLAGWPIRTALLGLIAAYRATLSGVMGGHCRFEPSCSAYAAQAIRSRGAFVGSALGMWRIVRCNPFARGGADPAPARHEYDGVIQGKHA